MRAFLPILAFAVALMLPVTLRAEAENASPPPPAIGGEAASQNLNSLPGVDMPPVIPGLMSDRRYEALKKLFEDKDAEVQRGALCQFASTQRVREDSHSLRLVKPFTRIIELHKPKGGVMQSESTYACALEALTTTIMTHGTFRESSRYKSSHYGSIGSPSFVRERLVPIYLPILKDPAHKLHTEAYYVFITLGEDVARQVVPTLVQQLNAIDHYTYKNQRQVETIVRTLHIMGLESMPAVPKMIELLLDPGEVDYEGNYGYDGKRGLNAELSSAMVSIAGYEKKYQRVMLKAINRALEQDEVYWSDKIRPQAQPGTTDLALTMEQSRDKMLKIMGLETVQEMKDLF